MHVLMPQKVHFFTYVFLMGACFVTDGKRLCDFADRFPGERNRACGQRKPSFSGITTSNAPAIANTAVLDCLDVYNSGDTASGIYTIKPLNWSGSAFTVYCNASNGGGWTVFQRRVDGSVNFSRNWSDYKEGFGRLDHEFWLGNNKLHYLTNQGKYELRIDYVNCRGDPSYAQYDSFRIGNEHEKYVFAEIGIGNTDINSGNMKHRLHESFSTYDQDNDQLNNNNCAAERGGGWWFNRPPYACGLSDLNSNYPVKWNGFLTCQDITTYTEMKIRPLDLDDNRITTNTAGATTNVSKELAETSTALVCPENMIYSRCDCQFTCKGSEVCLNNCTGNGTCICSEGYRLKEAECIKQEECPCFVSDEGKVISEYDFYVHPNCTMACSCNNATITCNGNYSCSPHAVCEVRNLKRNCYCKDGYRGDGNICTAVLDCIDVYNSGDTSSGIYTIKPLNWSGSAFEVYCNASNGGGWTVFQRRVDGSVNFARNWSDYKEGFGRLDHEFWLGNDKLHYITSQDKYELRIDFITCFGDPSYARYDSFRVGNEHEKYVMADIGNGNTDINSGNMNFRVHESFCTYDQDNRQYNDINCAANAGGGWWFNRPPYGCGSSVLNGNYPVKWFGFTTCQDITTSTEMKIRPL